MDPTSGLGLARVLIGLVSLVSPALAGRLFLLDPARNPQMSYVARLFGSRELALGAAALATSGRTRQAVVATGLAVDAADAAASALAGRNGVIGRGPATLLTCVALSAVVTGAVVLVGHRRLRAQVQRSSTTSATQPTTMISARSTAGGSRRP